MLNKNFLHIQEKLCTSFYLFQDYQLLFNILNEIQQQQQQEQQQKLERFSAFAVLGFRGVRCGLVSVWVLTVTD